MKRIGTLLALLCYVMLLNAETIQVGADGRSWILYTKSAAYHLAVSKSNVLEMCFWGGNAYQAEPLQRSLGAEVTVRGGFTEKTPMLEVVFDDEVRSIELEFVRAEVQDMDGYPTLIVYQKDKYYPLTVVEYIRVLPEYDLLEKWIEIKHTGKKGQIRVENAQSGTFFLPRGNYELTHLSGGWGSEFLPNKTLLTQGSKTLQVRDFRSFGSSFFALGIPGQCSETSGSYWYGTLQYSGNWRVDFEKYVSGEVQVTSGVNYWDQSVILKAGTSLVTPKFVIGYTTEGMEGVSLSLANYTRDKIQHPNHRHMVRPVLYNSWYATTFNVNEKHQLELAKIAKEIGVEIFVIDDGWFKGRVNDKAGLGDWTVDKKKFPNGLQSLISKVNALGLDFGIWIEPEMVNPNSDLYRAHPDWVFHYPNRTRHEQRNQLILNIAREDVYQYLYDSFSSLLRENNIKYIKWDMNRALADAGFPSAKTEDQRAVRMKYVENLYRLFDALRTEFPDVWFENCASGGGRIDLGMMQLTDCNWVSDNTDPIERTFIQYAYLNAFPANSMISWVTREDWHHQNPSLEFKFDVAMSGVLGVGYDITKWSPEEKELARKKIAQYKSIRETVHEGDLYRLVSPFETNRSVLQYVHKSGKETVLFVYNLAEYPANATLKTSSPQRIKLRGLQEEGKYQMEDNGPIYTGKMLMEIGINFPLRGAYKSQIIRIRRIG